MASSRPGIGKASSSHKSRGELLQEVAQLEWRAAKLNQRSTLLQSALDAMHDGLAVFDANLQLVGWNRHFLELVNLPLKPPPRAASASWISPATTEDAASTGRWTPNPMPVRSSSP